jgi:type I restriction enzyme S subunit
MSNKLPDGWVVKKLGDSKLIEIIDGDRGKNYPNQNDFSIDGFCLFMNTKNVRPDGFEFDTKMFISESKDKAMGKGKLKRNDVVMTTRGTIGNIGVYNDDVVYDNIRINSGMLIFRPNTKEITSDYLFKMLSSNIIKEQINKYVSGAAQPQLPIKTLINFTIPVPKSIHEQRRIVAILDEAFTAIATARENAVKNLANARELFESYLQDIFANPGDGWVEKRLGEVCIVERGSSPRPIEKYQTTDSDGVNWIKIGDTKNVEKYIYNTKEKITKQGAEKSRYVKEGDFILTNSMSYGKPYIMKTDGYIHDGWFVLRLNNNIDTEFFWYILASPFTMNQFISLASGAIVKNISGDLVKKTILPIPPLSEQKQIVTKLDALSAETKRLEGIYQQKIADLDELKKSILDKAFRGEM